jgi:hypothetical protein
METWRDITGFEGRYQVSTCGNVRSLFSADSHRIGRIRKPNMCVGYHRMGLRLNGKMRHLKVHRLVAVAFIPNPMNKPFVNHINGIRTDNRVENLEWCTHAENIEHAWRTGLAKPHHSPNSGKFKKGHAAKPVVALDDSGNVVARYNSGRDADKALGLSRGQVCRALKGRRNHTGGFQFKYA